LGCGFSALGLFVARIFEDWEFQSIRTGSNREKAMGWTSMNREPDSSFGEEYAKPFGFEKVQGLNIQGCQSPAIQGETEFRFVTL